MGTSKSNEGPPQGTPLLPPWAPPPPRNLPVEDEDGEKDKAPSTPKTPIPRISGDWNRARRDLAKYASDGHIDTLRRAAKSYVSASGGPRGAGATAVSGRKSVALLGRFLSSVASRGVDRSLHDIGLEHLVGESLETVFAAIADRIAPAGDLNESAVARQAVLDTMASLYDELSKNGQGLEVLARVDKAKIQEAITECVIAYIFERWLHELGLVLEKKKISEYKVLRLEAGIKDFIASAVNCDFTGIDLLNTDLTTGIGRRTIDKIFEDAYSALETV